MLYNSVGAALWATVMVSLAFFTGHVVPLKALLSGVAKFAIFALILLVAWIGVPMWLESRKQQLEPRE
jgi:membrane protein DedA with SNARE-associated domain